jgi:Protein of unknown function (DUF2924)
MLEMERVGACSAPTEPSRRQVRETGPDLARQLAALPGLCYADLRAEWRRLYRASPPNKIGRDVLELGVAWKLQERALGGLSSATRRRLADLAETLESKGDLTKARSAKLRPGARLLREWRGSSHEVLVTENGFLWRGERWRSLSVIAREITGTQWSGPRFFGLVRNARAQASWAPAAGEVGDA